MNKFELIKQSGLDCEYRKTNYSKAMKIIEQIFFLLFLFGITFPINAQEDINNGMKHPKVAVVLSGGGAKGFAHIGVLKILEEEGIPIDIIVGTSIGSLIGGIYSLGYTASEIEEIVKKQNWEMVLSDEVPRLSLSKNDQAIKQRYLLSLPLNKEISLSIQGLIKGQNVLNIFCGLAGNLSENADFSKLPISFACVATNLETGDEVVMSNGFLPTAMYSSMAIPGVFHPSEREGLILVDGGIVNNFPTDVAKKMGADIIIGVDIRGGLQNREKLKSVSEVLGNLINFYSKNKDSTNNSLCDLIIHPDITGYSTASFTTEAADTLILRGEKAANSLRNKIRELKTKYNLKQKTKSRNLVMPDKWNIVGLNFVGNRCDQNEMFFQKILKLQIPGIYSYSEIKNAINRLYGFGGFDKIYFSLSDVPGGKVLNLHIITKTDISQNIGFKGNTTDAAALLLNITMKNYGHRIGFLSASTELSANPGISLIAETNKINLPTLGLELKGKYQNYDVYKKGDKIYNADLFYISGKTYLHQSFQNQYNIEIGIQEEYYNGDVFSKNGNYQVPSEDENNDFLTNAYCYFSLDNMDHFYFPEKGTNLYAELSLNAETSDIDNSSLAFLFRMKNVIPLDQKTALLAEFYNRSIFNSSYPLIKTTFVGGDTYSQYFSYHLPFTGLPPLILADRYASVGLVGLRFKFHHSQYLSFIFNTLQQGSKLTRWNGPNAAYGGGIKYCIKTLVGPVNVGIGYSDLNSEPTFSANLGYWF